MPLKPKRISVSVPAELLPLLEIRKDEEHISSDSKFLLSLLLFDLSARCPHKITAEIVNAPERVFYKVISEIVEKFPTARTEVSAWLVKRMKKIQEEEAEAQKQANQDGPKNL